MNFILPLDAVSPQHRKVVGGKGYSLAVLKRNGFQVPHTWCITTAAYQHFVSATGLKPRLLMELNREEIQSPALGGTVGLRPPDSLPVRIG